MKKVLIFILLAIPAIVFGQLKVMTNGCVKSYNNFAIGSETGTSDTVSCSIYKQPETSLLGGYTGVKTRLRIPATQYCAYRQIGVLGIMTLYNTAGNTTTYNGNIGNSPYNSFVASIAGITPGGIGVYGATAAAIPTNIVGSYAGYFSGNVKVVGGLTATTITQSSDMRFKRDIQNITDLSLLEKIRNFRPVAYKFNDDTLLYSNFDNTKEKDIVHYGLIAQEVKEIFPNLVYEGQDGYLSINYTEIIPLLIGTINELTDKVEELEEHLESQQSRINQNNDGFNIEEAKLYQNVPNPFNASTLIEYELPTSTRNATIYIYDMNGTQLDSYQVTTFGKSSITINGGKLNAGIYLYSLIADGQVIDTKRMILTK